MMKNRENRNSGAIAVLLGAIAFSFGGLLVKLIPWSPIAINAGRCIFSSAVIGLYMRLSGHRFRFSRTMFLGALCVSAMLYTYVISNKLTSAANAIVLEYTAPVFVILFEALFFKRKTTKADLIVCILVLTGIAIVMSDGLKKGHLAGDLIALASGVFYAFTIMLNDFADGDSLSSVLLGHILTVFIGAYSIGAETDFSFRTLALLVLLGTFQAGLGYTLMTVGLKHCDAVRGSLIACVEPVLNPILVALFYGEYMSLKTVSGAFIVIASIAVYNIILQKE